MLHMLLEMLLSWGLRPEHDSSMVLVYGEVGEHDVDMG
jgi:hypothetical protein